MRQPFQGDGCEDLVAVGGRLRTDIASGISTTVVKTAQGRLCRVTITVAGTGAGSVNFYDATDGTALGTIIAAIPATISIPAGGSIVFDIPFKLGLVVVNVLNGPAFSVTVN